MWFSVPRKCQYSVQEPINRLQMKIHKIGRSHSKRPRGIFWCNWGQGRGILRTLSSITFPKNKTEICVLRSRLITIFSTCEKDKVPESRPAWPDLCVSCSKEAPRSWYCKASTAKIIIVCSPGTESGADPLSGFLRQTPHPSVFPGSHSHLLLLE